jgi:nucleolar protein 4
VSARRAPRPRARPAPRLISTPSRHSALEEDAADAVTQLNGTEVDGKKISVEVAKAGADGGRGGREGAPPAAAAAPPPVLSSKRPRPAEEPAAGGPAPGGVDFSTRKRHKLAPPLMPSATKDVTLVLLGLHPAADKKKLWVRLRKTAGAKACAFPVPFPGSTTGAVVALVTYATSTAAAAALRPLDGHNMLGAAVGARSGMAVVQGVEAAAKARIILRNLRFDATAVHVRNAIGRHATPSVGASVVDIHVPLAAGEVAAPVSMRASATAVAEEEESEEEVEGGTAGKGKGAAVPRGPPAPRNRGFAFIQAATAADAAALLAALNGKRVHKREVIADWAVPKTTLAAKAATEAAAAAAAAEAAAAAVPAAEGEEEEVTDEDSGEGDDGGEEEEDESEEEEKGGRNAPASRPAQPADAGEGGTLFLRNVSFDTLDGDLVAAFRPYGPVRYARIVTDRATGRSRGTAFVSFYTQEGADRALAAGGARDGSMGPDFAAPLPGEEGPSLARRASYAAAVEAALLDGGIRDKPGGRPLLLARARSQEESERAATLKAAEEGVGAGGKAYDKRHMYLRYEGTIRADSDTGKSLPPGDAAKREEAVRVKKGKLASPLFFVSPTRLSMRNLAKHITDAALKALVRDAAGAGVAAKLVSVTEGDPRLMPAPGARLPPVVVSTAKVLREPVTEAGGAGAVVGKSKGFGFVEFESHIHALAALRQLNNNPAYSAGFAAGGAAAAKAGKGLEETPRLIVEFAVENVAKVKQHEARRAVVVAKREALITAGVLKPRKERVRKAKKAKEAGAGAGGEGAPAAAAGDKAVAPVAAAGAAKASPVPTASAAAAVPAPSAPAPAPAVKAAGRSKAERSDRKKERKAKRAAGGPPAAQLQPPAKKARVSFAPEGRRGAGRGDLEDLVADVGPGGRRGSAQSKGSDKERRAGSKRAKASEARTDALIDSYLSGLYGDAGLSSAFS